jgi:predicted acyltransferase
MLLEPFEGGIKKVPQTLSYLFVSAGFSGAILVVSVIVADAFGQGRRLLRPLVDVGQNPMLAYVLYMLFLNHLLYLLGVGDFLTGDAVQATLRGFLVAGVVAALVWAASRSRLYWRA